MPLDIDRLEKLEQEVTERLNPDSDDYDAVAAQLNKISSLIDSHYKGQRKVDDAGMVTEEAPTRLPSRVGDNPANAGYFFEPNVREVQTFLRNSPQTLDRLGLRSWAEGTSQPEKREEVLDPMSGAPQGYNIVPARSYLDNLTESDSAYRVASDEMWRQQMEEAQRTGRSLKRYRDIKLDTDEWGDYVAGGITKGVNRVVAPALMGVADAATMGQAAPLGDAITDLADYELGKRGINLEDYVGPQPRSQEVINRNVPAYVAGNFAGYSLPRNPTNAIQNAATEALGYTGRGVVGRAGAAAVAGGVSNATEGVARDAARYANEGEPIPVGDLALNAVGNAVGNAVIGAAGGGLFDAAAQGISAARQGYRGLGRNAPLRTLEEAGGGADVLTGVSPTEEIKQAYIQQQAAQLDPRQAPRTVAGRMSEELAPQIAKSVKDREVANQERIAGQMDQYFEHPDYREIRVSPRPAIEGLIDLAKKSFSRGSSDGQFVAMDPDTVNQIGGILRDYADINSVPRADSPSVAHTTGGIVVDGRVANQLYGLNEGDIGYVKPGFDAVIRPKTNINAQDLTALEGRIDRELNFAAQRGNNNDPVWNRLNRSVKEDLRDRFPWYEDESGNLVPPPPDSEPRQPYEFADDVPRPPTRGEYMAPPTAVGGESPPKPEGLMGIGPEHRPPIPENPFDPRLPTAREAINPQRNVEVSGGEYGPPPPVDPNARIGVGPRFNPEPVQGFTEEGLPIPRVSVQPTRQVQGTYNRPPEVQIEPAPKTDRNPYGFADRGKPATERPLPPSDRPRTEEITKNGDFDEKVYQREYGPTTPAPRERLPANMTRDEYLAQGGETGYELPPEIQAKIDDGTLTTDAQQKAQGAELDRRYPPTGQSRGPLERQLDAQLENAPKVPQAEIDEIGAAQTADREQVADNWKNAEELFSKDKAARQAEVAKLKSIAEHPEVIEEAIAQIKNIDARLGPLTTEQKMKMVVDVIQQKLGRKIDPEDLIRFGLISAGAVQMATDDDDSGEGAAVAGIGAFFGRGKKGPAEPVPAGKKKPTQPTATLDNGKEVRGFSAKRNQQYKDNVAIEKAMKRLGVEGDTTLEGRIRTYGQLDDRGKVDQALLDEATHIGKERDLRNAAAANSYDKLKDRSWFGGNEGIAKAMLDFFGFRLYKGSEYLAGRHLRNTPRGEDGIYRNPYVREPSTLLGEMQRTLVEDPARRLLDLSRGGPMSRKGADYLYDKYKGDTVYEDKDEKKRKRASP